MGKHNAVLLRDFLDSDVERLKRILNVSDQYRPL